jgi:flagellar biosynthesis/type III secretory pathway M-ring protein FliF/YscJ
VGHDWGFRDAVTSGFRGAAAVINYAIAFVIATAPLWVVGVVVFFAVRAIIRRRRAARADADHE